MKNSELNENAVRKTIEDLIQTATTYDVDTLDRLYHKDLEVTMVDTSHNVSVAGKEDFKALFKSKGDAGDPPMNTWAKYHKVTVNGENAQVLLSRKNDLNGQNMDLFLSIDLLYEASRWQIRREAIFLRPEEKREEEKNENL